MNKPKKDTNKLVSIAEVEKGIMEKYIKDFNAVFLLASQRKKLRGYVL